MPYVIETDRFSWGCPDTFETEKEARKEVHEFIQDCRDNGGTRWRKTDMHLYEPGLVAEWEHISWDPSKPERVRIMKEA